MARPARPSVVLLSASGSLPDVDRLLRRSGVRVHRIASISTRPVDPRLWRGRLRRAPPPDTVIVTSRAAVEAGVRPWRQARPRLPRPLEFWAVGPGTSEALRQAGVRGVHRPRRSTAGEIARALPSRPPRCVVHFRSDRAGPRLARALRARGHRVVDLVVYRLQKMPRFTPRERRFLEEAGLLVVTSPSGLEAVRDRLDRPSFFRLTRSARLEVLGERSRRSARLLGFRYVSVAPSTTAQRFTRHLLRELRHARA